MRILPCGEYGILCELSDLTEVGALLTALTSARHHGELASVVDVVPGARTVLITVRPDRAELVTVARFVSEVDLAEWAEVGAPGVLVTIGVHYDGPDLRLVAETSGLSPDEVISAHSGVEYRVAFCGFAPGFGYLTGLPDVLRQPRLDQPRTRVPAGSVAIADEFTSIYPLASPGGWRLIGRTDEVLFDPRREPPALLAPGDRVRFEVVR